MSSSDNVNAITEMMEKKITVPTIIYKYISLKYGLKTLLEKKIKLSCPDSFNDPFDFSNDLIKFKVTNEYAKDLVKRRFPEVPRKERREKIRMLNSDPEIINITDKSISKSKSKYRVSCFSGTKEEVLMWSHYADKHNGICIGVSLPVITENYFVLPVKYTIDFNPIDFLENNDESLKYWMTTKYKKWDYEEEFRLINVQGLDFIGIN